ncbi:MAG: PAS domain S-box protein, partial [Kiritimatiellae bacterium]|nr:PAS domain S-box protein [Kiritimatiellia bacterium]
MSMNKVSGSGNGVEPSSGSRALKESLAVSELRYRRLFEAAKDGILILDAETGMVIDVNPFLTELIGYSHEQFIGKTIWELGFLKDVIANRDKFLELQKREYVRYENLPLETATGQRREVEFVSNVYQEGPKSVIQCNIRDITERKLAESRQRSSALFLSTLLEAIPTPVFYKDTEGRYLGFNKAFETFYGKKSCDMVGKTVFDVASPEMAGVFHDRDIELFKHPGVQVYSAKMKDGQGLMHDVIYHKATFNNAAGQVAGLIGVIIDTTEHVRLEEQFRQVHDDGVGMAPETLAHIFEPFFTTKGIGEGTGLGLATVYGIVKQNDGLIHASSRPGKGTTFLIYLPRAVDGTLETFTEREATSPRGSGETVLLVEDEQSLRNICSVFLDAQGYHVLEAGSPSDAVERSAQYQGDIQLVVTDVVMPGMAATEMVRRIGAMRPGVKVVFMSGYTADVIAQHGVLEKNVF